MRERQSSRHALIVAQLAIAVVVLVASGLMLRSVRALHAVRPGFSDADRQLTLPLSIPSSLVPTPGATAAMARQIVERLQALPGVTSAGFATTIPMEGTEPDWDVIVAEGQSGLSSGAMPPLRWFKQISPGLLRALGTQVVAGRDFTWDDMNPHERGVLVSENLARELWGSAGAAIGKRIQTLPRAPWHDVIGVVEDVREKGVQEPAPEIVYWPAYGESPYEGSPNAPQSFTLIIRSPRAGTAALVAEARQAIWSVRPDLAVFGAETMQAVYDRSMARTSFTLTTLLMAGAMALALGLMGVYGVVAYAVSRRTREMGIRLALGGQPRALVGSFVRRGIVLAGIAVPIGIVAAAALMRLINSLLYGVSAMDPPTYAAVAVVLALAAAAASYLPARRIASLDPIRTLNAQ